MRPSPLQHPLRQRHLVHPHVSRAGEREERALVALEGVEDGGEEGGLAGPGLERGDVEAALLEEGGEAPLLGRDEAQRLEGDDLGTGAVHGRTALLYHRSTVPFGLSENDPLSSWSAFSRTLPQKSCGHGRATGAPFMTYQETSTAFQSRRPAGGAKLVLIVEDNELNMKLFRDLLEAHGYQTSGTSNGYEALDLVRKMRPDLILMDIQLPQVSGLEVTKWIKDDPELRAIPVVAVTAFAMKGDEERIREGGCEAYLSKPISVGKFIETVRRFIG